MRKILLLDGGNKLYVGIKDDVICYQNTFEEGEERDMVVIYNFSPNYVSSVDKEQKVLIELLGKNHLKCLVQFMNSTFIPTIIEEKSWPDNVRK